jgi:hypothetical protein
MQSSLGAMVRLELGLWRPTTTNNTILVLGSTGNTENRRRRRPERSSLIDARVMPRAR